MEQKLLCRQIELLTKKETEESGLGKLARFILLIQKIENMEALAVTEVSIKDIIECVVLFSLAFASGYLK
jgi:hypothetical protein